MVRKAAGWKCVWKRLAHIMPEGEGVLTPAKRSISIREGGLNSVRMGGTLETAKARAAEANREVGTGGPPIWGYYTAVDCWFKKK
jgi:hypothetical protein